MDAPRVADREAHDLPYSIFFKKSRIYANNIKEETAVLHIPTSTENRSNITLIFKQDSSSNIYSEVREIINYAAVEALTDWKYYRDIVVIVPISLNAKVAAAVVSAAAVAYVDPSEAASETVGSPTYIKIDSKFGSHVNNLMHTMFYVCQGSCLCGTVNNRGKVIYCYGDLVPRHGELFQEGSDGSGTTSSKDLLAAQLGVWTFGLILLLIVLLLIRKSITQLRRNLQKVTERLPLYHDDDLASTHSATSPSIGAKVDSTGAPIDMGPPDMFSDDGTLTPDPDALTDESPLSVGVRLGSLATSAGPVSKLKTMKIGRKDFKKGGEGLRGKNVTEAFRVKEKDVKRTMKCHLPNIEFYRTPSSSSIIANVHADPDGNITPDEPEIRKQHKHHQRRTRIKSIVTPRRMKRGKSEEPFLPQDENSKGDFSDSGDDILYDKDVVAAAAKAQEEEEVYHKMMERRNEWNRARKDSNDCHVSCRLPTPPATLPYPDEYLIRRNDDAPSSSDDVLESSKDHRKMMKITKAPINRNYSKAYATDIQGEEDLVLTVVKFERDRKPRTTTGELSEVSKV